MGLTHFPDGINAGDSAGNAGTLAIGGTAITVTADQINALGSGLSATELDYLDGAVAGTLAASKALVVSSAKAIDVLTMTLGTITTLNTGTFQLNGTAVTANAAEMNTLGGQTLKYRAGTLTATAAGTAATGLGTVSYVTASLATIGTGSAFVSVAPAGAGGTVVFAVFNSAAAAATDAGTIHWVAAGT